MKLIILGGDVRLRYTADRLSRKHEVYTYGQSDRDMLPDGKCDVAVLGIPASRDGININAPLCDEPIPLSLLTALLKPHSYRRHDNSCGEKFLCKKRVFLRGSLCR